MCIQCNQYNIHLTWSPLKSIWSLSVRWLPIQRVHRPILSHCHIGGFSYFNIAGQGLPNPSAANKSAFYFHFLAPVHLLCF